jgi:hypothetical protein
MAKSEGVGLMTKPRKRPRDFSQAAKMVVDIATGQAEDRVLSVERNPRGNRNSLLGACQGVVGVAQMPEHAPQKEVAVGSTVKSEMES